MIKCKVTAQANITVLPGSTVYVTALQYAAAQDCLEAIGDTPKADATNFDAMTNAQLRALAYDAMTSAQLRALADEMGIKLPANANKTTIIAAIKGGG